MIFWLTVCFYLFTAVAAILGILAQVWTKDQPTRANRLRWASIGFIALIFCANVLKENLVDIRSQDEKANTERRQDKLEQKIEAQSSKIESQLDEIGNLQKQLGEARETVVDTRKKLVEAQLASRKTIEAIQPYAYKRLSGATRAYLTFIRDILFYGSDGWEPKSEEEFFSLRAAAVICGQLDVSKPAPVLPGRPWRNWIAESAGQYKKALDEILRDYPGFLDPELVKKVTPVEHLALFAFSTSLVLTPQIDRELGVHRPPLMCHGGEAVIEKDLIALFSLYKEIRTNERRYGFTSNWNFLNMASDKRWPRHLLGKDRFTQEMRQRPFSDPTAK